MRALVGIVNTLMACFLGLSFGFLLAIVVPDWRFFPLMVKIMVNVLAFGLLSGTVIHTTLAYIAFTFKR